MEPSSQPQHGMGVAVGASQVYPTSAYPTAATVAAPIVASANLQLAQPFPTPSAQHQIVYQQTQQFHQHLQQQLQKFWVERMTENEAMTDFKNHNFPLASIKKTMKADEDVRMISAEAPVIFTKACEIFIIELTQRSWMHTKENKHGTLQKNDIAAAINFPRTGLPPMGALEMHIHTAICHSSR